MSEAVVRTATTTLSIIEGEEQLKQVDDLTIETKKLLIVKGGNTQKLVNRIFTEFSNRVDRAGNKFKLAASGVRYQRQIPMAQPRG